LKVLFRNGEKLLKRSEILKLYHLFKGKALQNLTSFVSTDEF